MTCNPNPFVEHGFSRNASHSSDRYVCMCEGVTKESLLLDLEAQMDYLLLQYEKHGEYNEHELGCLIRLAQAVRWEISNE